MLGSLEGAAIPQRDSMVYLGGLLNADGGSGPELSRRIGMAYKQFHSLCKIWKHAKIPMIKKVRIFQSCVVSGLMYCLHTLWLNKAELRKLDAFQARCLRKVAGIAHSFISRVSNDAVLAHCSCQKLSSQLACQQLVFLGKVARMPDDSAVRRCVFAPGSFCLSRLGGRRTRGRPKNKCTRNLLAMACKAAGGEDRLPQILQGSAQTWRHAARNFCSQISV